MGDLGRVRLHPWFVLLSVLAIAAGLWRDVAVLFLLILLHEMGHAAMAAHLGYVVEEVSLLPFGGVAKIAYGWIGFRPRHEAVIAMAGPVVNLALVVFAYVVHALHGWDDAFFHLVVEQNAWIVLFNLLPGLPLDGGRLLRAARVRSVGFELATQEGYAVSLAIAAVLAALGLASLAAGHPHLGMVLLSGFLFAAAWRGRRDLAMETVRFLDAKRRQPRVPERVRAIAAPAHASIRDVARQFAPDRYHMVYVLGPDGAVQTILEEDEVLAAVFAGRWTERLADWIARG
ncbi:peptidase M50 [Alicyclobacillus cellulosilyticus]|uniref:Peptidase M50 n=2 Tax=Alicyclobacillus cellulosilyticus TaxID=1003997 RepID=A0A917NFL8_9BACL|nr:peptidase M50 [Alicyclobacillus cellulosilyticus]